MFSVLIGSQLIMSTTDKLGHIYKNTELAVRLEDRRGGKDHVLYKTFSTACLYLHLNFFNVV